MPKHRTTNMRKCRCVRFWHSFRLPRRGEKVAYFPLCTTKSSQGVSCVLATVSVLHLLPQETGGCLDQPLVCLLKGAVVFPQKQQYAAHKVALG